LTISIIILLNGKIANKTVDKLLHYAGWLVPSSLARPRGSNKLGAPPTLPPPPENKLL